MQYDPKNYADGYYVPTRSACAAPLPAPEPGPTNLIDFSHALEALKQGKRVARAGWNGKGMWLMLIDCGPSATYAMQDLANHADCDTAVIGLPLLPWVGMKTADDKFVPWLCSQTDMLAEDWEILGSVP